MRVAPYNIVRMYGHSHWGVCAYGARTAGRRDEVPAPTDPERLDRDDPLPLWAQLASDVRRRITAGAFADRFPTEADLQDEYEVSRHTVREALRRLREDGTVVSERGRGSHLARAIAQPLGTLYSLFDVIESQGIEQRSEVRRLEVVRDPVVAEHLGLGADDELVVVERRRLADGEPLALDTAWLPAALARPLLDADLRRTALYAELSSRCGVRVDAGRERIAPVVPDASECDALDIGAGTGAFRVLRRASAGTTPVEWRTTLLRGDRYCFVASWSDTTAFRLDLVPTESPAAGPAI